MFIILFFHSSNVAMMTQSIFSWKSPKLNITMVLLLDQILKNSMGALLILIIYFSVLMDQVFKYHLEYSRNKPLFYLTWALPIPKKFTLKLLRGLGGTWRCLTTGVR